MSGALREVLSTKYFKYLSAKYPALQAESLLIVLLSLVLSTYESIKSIQKMNNQFLIERLQWCKDYDYQFYLANALFQVGAWIISEVSKQSKCKAHDTHDTLHYGRSKKYLDCVCQSDFL
jgi:hypothetical protein